MQCIGTGRKYFINQVTLCEVLAVSCLATIVRVSSNVVSTPLRYISFNHAINHVGGTIQ
jgi:hypothetical protein